MKQDEVNAYYMPSSYTMYIDSYDPIEKHTDFDNKIFFHEFTHFLQDLTLPYLMRQATIMNNSIYNFIEQCKKKQEVTAPFFWHDDYYVTSQQYEYTWGEGKYIEDFGSIVSHKQQSEHSIGDIEIHRFTLESSNGITYPLSARDFLEYLSLCLQNKRWKKIEHIDIPYNIIRLTIDYLEFNILSDSSKVLLIEFCLYNDNPVAQLFFIHKNMRQDIIRHDTKGTLHIFLKNLVWNSKGNHSYNTSEKLRKRKEQLIDCFFCCYSDNNFTQLREWLLNALNYKFPETHSPFLFHELFLLDPLTLKFRLEEFLNLIKIPVIINKYNHFEISVPNSDFLHAAHLFIRATTDSDKTCPLIKYRLCRGSNRYNSWCKCDFFQTLSLKENCVMFKFMCIFNINNFQLQRISLI